MNARVDALRAAFDQGFAAAPLDVTVGESLLAIHAGSRPLVVRLTEVSELFVDWKVTSVPSTVPELIGITGFRGTLLPVYDLGLLLGYAKSEAPRWLLVTAVTPVGLAFDGFEGHVTVPAGSLVSSHAQALGDRRVPEVAHVQGVARPLVSLVTVLDAIRNRAAREGPKRSDE